MTRFSPSHLSLHSLRERRGRSGGRQEAAGKEKKAKVLMGFHFSPLASLPPSFPFLHRQGVIDQGGRRRGQVFCRKKERKDEEAVCFPEERGRMKKAWTKEERSLTHSVQTYEKEGGLWRWERGCMGG